MDLNCPWGALAPASISFCEPRLCAWVAEPSNAFSNVAYLVPAIYAWRHRDLALPVRALAAFASTMLACTSFFFHSTGSRVGELADVSSMYVLPTLSIGVLLTDRGQRLLGFLLPFLTWGAATALMAATGSDGIVAWGTLALVAIVVESRRAQVLPPQTRWFNMVGVLASFFVGYAVWWLDKLDIACSPANHIFTGHAFWHCATAGAQVFFYRQFAQVAHARRLAGATV